MSLVYPVGRGSGALLAALAGIVLLGEHPGPAGLAGIGLVIAGILLLGASAGGGVSRRTRPASRALAFALVTGVFIASYTLWDKYAVSTLEVPPLLQGYAAMPVMALVLAPFALRQRPRTTLVWQTCRRQVAGAAVLAPLAYILVLAALSFTAVSAVAPAREVSVLAGVLLGRRLLGEGQLAPPGWPRRPPSRQASSASPSANAAQPRCPPSLRRGHVHFTDLVRNDPDKTGT